MAQSAETAEKHEWKVAITGELMATLPFSIHKEPGFLKVKEKLESVDFCYEHLEMLYGDFSIAVPGRMRIGGSHLLDDPEVARDLRWMGIDIVSLCHNHGGDFGAAVAPKTRDFIFHFQGDDRTCVFSRSDDYSIYSEIHQGDF